MPGPATGEVYTFAEGKLFLYASASGATTGSGIGFAENARLRLTYGWHNYRTLDGVYHDLLTGQRADLSIGTLYADRVLFALVNASAAVNARFEGSQPSLGRSALFVLYSGAVDNFEIEQANAQNWRAAYGMHANTWSAFGQ